MSNAIPNPYLKPGAFELRPLLRTHLRYGALADNLTLVFGETESLLIEMIDKADLRLLLPLLDGKRTVRQIIRTLDGRIDATPVTWRIVTSSIAANRFRN